MPKASLDSTVCKREKTNRADRTLPKGLNFISTAIFLISCVRSETNPLPGRAPDHHEVEEPW